MFYKVAITVLIFTLLLPWFTPAMGAFEHCPSCDKESCQLSAAECRHNKKMEMDKIKEEHALFAGPSMGNGSNNGPKSGHVKDSSVIGAKECKQGKADGCAIKVSCAEKSGYSLTLNPAKPHLITRHNPLLTCLRFLSYTFFGFTEFKDPYPAAIYRPPATHPFYN